MNIVKQSIFDFVSSCLPDFQSGFNLFVLKVNNVDRKNRIVAAEDDNGNIFPNLSLRLIGGSILPVPSVGSYILALINQQVSVGYVIQCSKIESAEIVIGKSSAVMDADGCRIDTDKMSAHINMEDIVFNGGSLDGMVVIQKLTDKLNELVNTFNSHTHNVTVAHPGGLFTTVPPGSAAAAFNKSDYENTKIKQ